MPEPGARRFIATLRDVLERREKSRSPLRIVRVTGRETDGALRVQRLDAECEHRGAPTNNFGGQIIPEPAGSHYSRRGASGVSVVQEAAVTDVLWVERIDPNVFYPGQSYTVSVIGRGFTETTRFDFLEPRGRVINPDIEILATRFIDPQLCELDITVSPGARIFRQGAPLAYGYGEIG